MAYGTSVNVGDQLLQIRWKDPVVPEQTNRMLSEVVSMGVYSGNTLDNSVGNTVVTLDPGVHVFWAADLTHTENIHFFKCTTQSSFDLALAQANGNNYVIGQYKWEDIREKYVQFSVVASAPTPEGSTVCFGNAIASGGTITRIDYTPRTGGGKNIRVSNADMTSGYLSDKMPIGMLTPYYGTTCSCAYWLMCDGSSYSNNQYPELSAHLQANDPSLVGATTFNTPNMKSRVAVGYDSGSVSFNSLYSKVGEYSHVITGTETGTHGHTATTSSSYADSHWHDGDSRADTPGPGWTDELAHKAQTPGSGVSSTTTVANFVGGSAHNNVQESYVMNYIIFAGSPKV